MSTTKIIFTKNFAWEKQSDGDYRGPDVMPGMHYELHYSFIMGRWELIDNLGNIYDSEPGKFTKKAARTLIDRVEDAIFGTAEEQAKAKNDLGQIAPTDSYWKA